MAIILTDDGTMDTVLKCDECDKEFRFNYDPGSDPIERDDMGFYKVNNLRFPTEQGANIALYENWVMDHIAETVKEHVCGGDGDA